MKKASLYILIFTLAVSFFVPIFMVSAQGTVYTPLAPLPGLPTIIDAAAPHAFGTYLNIMIRLTIGLIAVGAVVMIFLGGIEYMTSEVIFNKEHGKERIRNAIFGLLLALGSYVILNTINPALLKSDLNPPEVTINIPEDANSAIIKTSGNCSVAGSGPCAPSNLSTFGPNAGDASRICSVESGGVVDRASTYDKCTDGRVFSYGLFQINLIANGGLVGPGCTDLFTLSNGEAIEGNNYIKRNSNGSYYYDCKLKSSPANVATRFQACAQILQDPVRNTAVALQLFNTHSPPPFQSWYHSDQTVCGSSVSGW